MSFYMVNQKPNLNPSQLTIGINKSVDIPLPCNPSNFKQRAPRVCLLFWKSKNLLIYHNPLRHIFRFPQEKTRKHICICQLMTRQLTMVLFPFFFFLLNSFFHEDKSNTDKIIYALWDEMFKLQIYFCFGKL